MDRQDSIAPPPAAEAGGMPPHQVDAPTFAAGLHQRGSWNWGREPRQPQVQDKRVAKKEWMRRCLICETSENAGFWRSVIVG